MAEQKRKISYGIDFEVNDAELKKLKKQLEQFKKLSVVNYASQQGISLNNPKIAQTQAHQLAQLKKDAAEFQRLMRLAYNPKTNSYNITKFNAALNQSRLGVKLFGAAIQKTAEEKVKLFRTEMQKTAEGRAAWAAQINELTKFNTEIKQSHKLLDSLGKTLANTIKWTISSSLMQGVTRSISQAYGFAKNLDSALNDIRIVTGKSADEMARFAERANAVASNLGKGTNDYTRAALIYAQQGLGQKEIEEKTAITLKTANVTGQSAEEVSEELTAVWNGYKVSAEQAELYVDRLAAVASTTASNLQELSTGMSKVASAAATLGVGEDQLAAQLSTIISVTRQAPETVGTALRTVYARITDIQAGLDEDGVTLGKYSGDMAKIGINVLDLNGNLRNMGEVMEEIGNKWSTMTQEQKIYLAQTMAGQRQYSNLMALFDNFDKYESALNTAQNAEGKLQEQQDIYMDRLSTHVQQLTTATEHMWMGLVDTDGFKDVIDGLTTIVEKVDKLFQSIGGGKNLLQSLVPIVMSLTSKTIASGINTMIINSQLEKRQLRDQKSSQVLAQNEMKALQSEGQQGSQRYQVLKQKSEFLQAAPGTFSAQQMDEINKRWSGSLEAADAADKARSRLAGVSGAVEIVSGINPLDTKASIDTLEGAIETASKSYKKLSNSVNNFIQQQNATNQSQNEAQKDLIDDYNKAVKTEQGIIQEENERQQVLSKAAKRFGVVFMPGQPIEGETLQQLSDKVDAEQSQQQNSIKKIQQSINFSTVNQGQGFLTENAYKGISNSFNGGKITQDQFGALEQLSQFQSLKNFSGKDKRTELKRLLKGSIFEDVFNDQKKKSSSGKVKQDKFITAVKNRVISLKQSLKKAEQELGKIQNIKNNFIPSNNYAQLSQLAAQDVQNAQNALKNQSQTNLTIQRSGEFTQILDILNKQLPQAASKSKEKLLDFSQRFNDINKKVLDFNTSIGKTNLSNVEEVQKLIEEREKLIQERADFLQEFEDFSNDVGDNIISQGEEAVQTRRDADSIIENNDEANNDTQNDADRQEAIQAAIQLSSSLIQLQTSFSSIKEALSSDDGNQIFQNLLINIPLLVSGIVTTINSIKVLKANIGLLGKEMTGTLIPGIQGVNTTLGATMITVVAGIAVLMAIKSIAEAYQKSLQGQIKVNENIIKTEKEKQEIYKNQLGIIAEVEELNNKYKQGEISKGQLIEKTQELQEKYKDESNEIKELISNYNHLQQAAKKAKENQLNELKKSKDKQLEAASRNVDWRLQGRQYSQNDLFDSFNIFAMAARSRGSAVFNAGWGQGKAEASLAAALQQADLGNQFGSYIELYNAKTSQEAARQIEILQKWADTTSETNTDLFRNVQAFLEEQKPFLEDWKKSQLQRLKIVSQSEALNYSQDFNNVNTVQEYQTAYREVYGKIYNKAEEEGDLEGLDSEKIKETITNQVNSIIPTKLKESYKSYVDVIDKIQSSNPNIKLTDSQKKEIKNEIFNLNEDQLNAFSTNSFELASNAQDIENAARNISKMDFSNMQPFTAASIESVAESYEKIQQIIKAIQEGKTIKNTAIKQLLEDKNFDFTEEQIKSLMQQRFSGNWETRDDITQQQVIDFFRSKAIEKSQNDIKKNQSNIDILKNKPKVNDIKPQDESSLSFNNPIQEPLFTEQDFFIRNEKLKSASLTDQINAFFNDYDFGEFNSNHPGSSNYSTALMKELIEQAKLAGLSEYELKSYAANVHTGESIDDFIFETPQMTEFKQRVQSLLQGIPYVEASETEDKVNREAVSKNKTNAEFMLKALDKVGYEDQIKLSSWKQQVDSDNGPSEDTFTQIYKAYQSNIKDLEKIPENLKEENETLKEKYRLLYQQEFPTDLDIDKSLQKQLAEQYQLMAEKSELLDKALKNNTKNAKDVAAAILRYQAAIDKTADSYSSWIDILNNGSTAEKIKIMPDLKDAFGDVLDINGLNLSNTFATTSSNLELMKMALEDTGQAGKQAYEKLQQLAQLDILNNMGLNGGQIAGIQNQLDNLKGFVDDESIKTGTELWYDDVKGYLEKILAINKNITSEQLTHLLTLMNIDADLVVTNGHIQKINAFAKSATYELKQQQTSADKLKDLQRERIKNQKELTKYLRDDRDLYHEINILLKDQERIINRITKNQASMYGAELLQNLSAQTNELRKQQALLKSKQQMQLQDMANRKSALASQGAAFDSNGNIINYNNLIGSAMNKVNEIISRQNGIISAKNNIISSGGSTNDEVYKNLELQEFLINREKSNAQEYLSNLKSDLSAYESVKSNFEDVIDQLSDLVYQKIELRLKEFKVKVDVKYDLIQLQKDYDDFRRNIVEHDDILNPNKVKTILKDSAQYFSDALSSLNYLPSLADDLQKAINEANKFNDINYDPAQDPNAIFKTQGQAKTYLQQALEKVNSQSKDVLSNIDEIKNKILELANELKDVYTKQEQHLSFIREQINHDISLSKLLYGEENYKNLNKYYDQLKTYNLKSVEDAKSQQQMFLELYQRETDKALKDIYLQNYKQATKTLNSILESSLQDLKTRYENAINEVLKNTKEKLGFTYNTGLEWDLMKKQNDTFLDKVNSIFAIKNTEFLYNQAINDIDSISAQVKLKNVMNQQLEILKEKQQLTQYDVDRAQKVLDIQKARIALEQAQNNKTNMRLKRDSQGNYSYQFVADEDEIAKAQNDLQKTQNDLYNFDKEHYIENLNQAQELYEEYANKIREIKLNDNLNQTEKTKALGLLREDFEKRILKIWKQNEFIKRNLMDSTANSLKMNLQNMSAAEQNYFMGQSIPMWNSSAQQILNKFIDDPNSVYNEIENMYSSLTQAQNDYQSSIDQSLEKAGTSYEQFKKTGIDPVVDSMKELIKNNNELAKEANTIVEEMQPLKTTLGSLTNKWEEMRKKIEEVNGQIQNYLINMGKAALAAQNNGNNGGGTLFSGLPTQLTDYSTSGSAGGGGTTQSQPQKSSALESSKKNFIDNLSNEIFNLKGDTGIINALKFEDGGKIHTELSDSYMAKRRYGHSVILAITESLKAYDYLTEDGQRKKKQDQVAAEFRRILKTILDKNGQSRRGSLDAFVKESGIDSSGIIAGEAGLKPFLRFIYGFDTGGYTGSWNSSDGKLAMLHQKELVLNKQDTKNILNAVSLVRTITNNLASNLMSQINSIGKFENMTKTFMNDKFNQIEQNVKIQANFPNVNSKQEIEDAFAELVNMAAQRALRKK